MGCTVNTVTVGGAGEDTIQHIKYRHQETQRNTEQIMYDQYMHSCAHNIQQVHKLINVT